jgi:hypothetical protein
MSKQRLNLLATTAVAVFSFLTAAGVPAHAATPLPKIHFRGTISQVTATTLTVATSRGVETLALGPKTVVVEALPASRSDIKPNSFLGVTSIPGAGDAKAVGVLLIPDAFRNAPADAGWDWPGAGSGSSMANGTVSEGSHMTNGTVTEGSHMTNGTASFTSGNGPLTVRLNYTSQAGSKVVTIPTGTPVARIVFAKPSALKPGSHLFVFAANNNGQLAAGIIVVGAPGVTPPM